MAIDFSQNPYFDDFDETKDFYRILFRPSYAVQSRELTQIQTLLQKQIERFGGHIFKNGSMVLGGQTTLETDKVSYVMLAKTHNGETIDTANFVGKFIVDTTNRGVRAYVVQVIAQTDETQPILMVKYVTNAEFASGDLNIQTEDALYGADVYTPLPTETFSATGNGSICSIDTGVFFVNGLFVYVAPQTLILDYNSQTPTYRVGLEITESVVDEGADSTLLDPALDASNYQAPGATRYKVTLTLAKRSLSSTDDTAFIDMLRVENGKLTKKILYAQNSELENTLARRTYDESGSYTVRPFQLALSADSTYANAYNAILEAGKAYVLGYEYETIAPTIVKSERARDVANVYNYPLTIDYQNYVDVTKLTGPIYFNTLHPLDVHCVNTASIDVTSTTNASATKIGTIRIRALDYQSGANTTSINTAIWRAYVMDANLSSHSANAQDGTANTIILDANAASQNNAYLGMTVRIVTDQGASVSESRVISEYNGVTKTATVSRNFGFGIPSSATIFSLDYELKSAESFVYASSANSQQITTMMDVASDSKLDVLVDPYQGTYVTDTDYNRAILEFPNFAIGGQYVVGGTPITNSEYYARKMYDKTFSSNVITFTTESGITAAVNGSPLSTSDAIDNILVITTSAGTLANNQVINFANSSNTVAVTTSGLTSQYTITVPNAGTQSAKVYVKVKIPYAHIGFRKAKAIKTANTQTCETSAPLVTPKVVDSSTTWYKQSVTASGGAQIIFKPAGLTKLKTPNQPQSIYTADVIRLRGVYDFGTYAATTANLAYVTDLTSSYVLDNGQRDNSYDHATITLQPNRSGPVGNTVVYVDYYDHTGLGYLTVDSYIDAGVAYEDIPKYTSGQTAKVYFLRDCVDFRPRRIDGDTSGEFTETLLGISGTNLETDFSYYLPRIDKLVLTKDRNFEVVRGISSLSPKPPADLDNAMTLYVLTLPAYTFSYKDISVKYIDNRRYTMRDIGTLEKRISNLEYYTSLSLLEQEAKNSQIVDDETGLNRFKNGIIVDSFKGHGTGDTRRPDYICSIDQQQQELRSAFLTHNYPLFLDKDASDANYQRHGAILTLKYTPVTFVEQPVASQWININPFNVIVFTAQIKLDPASDQWPDTQLPPVVVPIVDEGEHDVYTGVVESVPAAMPVDPPPGEPTEPVTEPDSNGRWWNGLWFEGRWWDHTCVPLQRWWSEQNPGDVPGGAWNRNWWSGKGFTGGWNFPPGLEGRANEWYSQYVASTGQHPRELSSPIFGAVWNNWQTQWSGISDIDEQINDPDTRGGKGRQPIYGKALENTLDDVTTYDIRNNLSTTFPRNSVTKSVGNKIADASVIPHIRSRGILVSGKGFLPNTTLNGFFDDEPIQPYLHKINEIEVDGLDHDYITDYQNNEVVRIYDPVAGTNVAYGTVTSKRNGSSTMFVGLASLLAGDDANIANVRILTSNPVFMIGRDSAANTRIVGYHHHSGFAVAGNTNTIILGRDVFSSNTENTFIGKTISITSGCGNGKTYNITAYNVSTREVTIDTPWHEIPNNTSSYSIGTVEADHRGEAQAIFMIPADDTKKFRTGERVLKFTDHPDGDVDQSKTSGETRYVAHGMLSTQAQTIVSTRVPDIQSPTKKEQKDLFSSVIQRSQSSKSSPIDWHDPVSETFWVDQKQYPNGVQLTSVRIVFRSKDDSIPVRLQIRPVVNGYPHSSQVMPYGDVWLNAEDVIAVDEATMAARLKSDTEASPLDDPAFYTEFFFDAPLTLQSGQEYAIVLQANSIKYEVYISEIGQTILGTDRIISEQPYLGSFFKSQNSSTWTPVQEQDLMFRLMRASYTADVANVEFIGAESYSATANTPVDAFYVTSQNLVLPNTKIDTLYSTRLETGAQESFRTFDLENNVIFEDTLGRRVISYDNDSFRLRAYLRTQSADISPFIDMERLSVVAVENSINNLGLSNDSLIVVSSDKTFPNANVISVAITGGGGSGANARAVVVSNTITSFVVDNPGSGYTSNPTVTITSASGAATAVAIGELSASGGPAYARYITRKIVLADDMDAGDLRVYFSAYRPVNSNIYVYYKLLSADDTTNFNAQTYQLMTCIQGYNNVSLSSKDFKSFTFAPGTNNVADNKVAYGSFTSFKYFAIKVVMTSTNPTTVPRIKNFRAVALPALS